MNEWRPTGQSCGRGFPAWPEADLESLAENLGSRRSLLCWRKQVAWEFRSLTPRPLSYSQHWLLSQGLRFLICPASALEGAIAEVTPGGLCVPVPHPSSTEASCLGEQSLGVAATVTPPLFRDIGGDA